MALAKPYQVWAQERANSQADEQASRLVQQSAMAQMQASVSDFKPPARTVHAPTHDRAASDRLAAQRAMGLEARQQQHGYGMEELDRRAELGREEDLWKINLRQRFAPKGAGPVAQTEREIVKLATEKEPGESPEARRARIEMLINRLDRMGSGGKRVASEFRSTGFLERYTPKLKSQREATEAAGKERALDTRASAANQARIDAAKAGASVRAANSETVTRLRALQSLAKEPKDMFSDTPQIKAQRANARKQLELLAGSLGGKSVDGKTYFTTPDGSYVTDDDDED